MLAHFTGKISQYFMTIIKPHTELGARQGLDHQTIHFDLAFFFCHTRILIALLIILKGASLDAADCLLLCHSTLFAFGDEPAFVADWGLYINLFSFFFCKTFYK